MQNAECLASKLAPALQQLFIRHLEALRTALINYRFEGAQALERALDEVAGSMARNQESIKAELGSSRDFVSSFFDALGKMNDLVSKGQNIYSIGAQAATWFLKLLN